MSIELEWHEIRRSPFVRATFKTDIIPKAHARLILDQFEALLRDTVTGLDRGASALPTVSGDLISVTPAKELSLPSPVRLLHQFVELRAQQQPHELAFEFFTKDGDGALCSTIDNDVVISIGIFWPHQTVTVPCVRQR